MADHYTAFITIDAVTDAKPGTQRAGNYTVQDTPSKPREVSEVLKLTVRGDDLGTLKERLTAHIQLVEED